jgi:hypothetical protein
LSEQNIVGWKKEGCKLSVCVSVHAHACTHITLE